MGSGLIWAGIGQGISGAGSTIGNSMMRAIERDTEDERRRREREEDRTFRRELQDDAQASRAAQDLLYRRQQGAAGGSGAGGAGGGLSAQQIGEGGDAEGIVAGELGMTVPELRTLRKYRDTGDAEPYKKGRTVERSALAADDEEGGQRRYNVKETVRDLPEGFEKEADAKVKALSRIEMSMRMGKDNKGYQEGETTRLQRENAESARDGTMSTGKATELNMAADGKGPWRVQGNTAINEATGATDTTDVGDSVIDKNKRAPAPGGGKGGGGGGDLKAIQQLRIGAEKSLADARRALTEFDKLGKDMSSSERAKRSGDRQALVDEVNAARSNLSSINDRLTRRLDGASAPAPTPAPTKPKAGSSGSKSYSSLWN